MIGEPTTGIDRFIRELRGELVGTLYGPRQAKGTPGAVVGQLAPAPGWRSWRRRLVALAAAAAVATGLIVAPSLVRGDGGAADALAVTPLPDGRVRIDMPGDVNDPRLLAARLRPYGVQVLRCGRPPLVPADQVGRTVAFGFGPISSKGWWPVPTPGRPGPPLDRPVVRRLQLDRVRLTFTLDPRRHASGQRGPVGWLYLYIDQGTRGRPTLSPLFRFIASTSASGNALRSASCS
jgi:hypothetical protein